MMSVASGIDSLQIVSWRCRPRSFLALMSLYESNYLRFLELAPCADRLPHRAVSRVPGHCDLILTRGECGPYTTTLQLTYSLADGAEPVTAPDMTLRLYHDARL
ncbi:MAG: DUF1249 domain-containing protein, partial [Steroidobacteraceae bacterium]|nr:DUF1249 domain-containing protein [Steroidobacteraceae bacterium]